MANNNDPATYSNKQEIVDELNKAVILGGDDETLKKHINRIKDKVGKHRVFD